MAAATGVRNYANKKSTWWESAISILFTFIAVTVAWVFFRADSVSTATEMIKGMIGMRGFHLPEHYFSYLGSAGQFFKLIGISFGDVPGLSMDAIISIMISLFICWFLPNVQEYMSNYQPSLDSFPGESKKPRFSFLKWMPSFGNAAATTLIAIVALLGMNKVSEFIYFQF